MVRAAVQHRTREDWTVVALGVGELVGVEEMAEQGVVALGGVLDPEETAGLAPGTDGSAETIGQIVSRSSALRYAMICATCSFVTSTVC